MTPEERIKIIERIVELKKQAKAKLETRRFYGETGFRRTKLTDDLLREAESLEGQARELERLLKESQ